jgi:hypothetical protein
VGELEDDGKKTDVLKVATVVDGVPPGGRGPVANTPVWPSVDDTPDASAAATTDSGFSLGQYRAHICMIRSIMNP